MYKEKKILGIVTARGGSKGLPQKNILPLFGRPLIAWTVEQALRSKYIDKVIVSTDDEEIASAAKGAGAEVPFLRPVFLATDDASSTDVLLHAIGKMEEIDKSYDLVFLLQPTSPLRNADDIDCAVELLFAKNARAVVSVCEAEHHPYWSNVLPRDGCMKDFMRTEIMNKNRQDLPIFYRLNGAIYVAYCDYVREKKGFMGEKTYAYIMPAERSVDIDSKIDFEFAEFLLQRG